MQAHERKQGLPLLQCALPEANGIFGKGWFASCLGVWEQTIEKASICFGKGTEKACICCGKGRESKAQERCRQERKEEPCKNLFGKGEEKALTQDKETVATKNPRAYLAGTTEKGGKLKLIVEVSGAGCPDWHSQMIDEIWTSLEKEALTKSEARALRENFARNGVPTGRCCMCTSSMWKSAPAILKQVGAFGKGHASEKCPARQAPTWGQPTADQICLRKNASKKALGPGGVRLEI